MLIMGACRASWQASSEGTEVQINQQENAAITKKASDEKIDLEVNSFGQSCSLQPRPIAAAVRRFALLCSDWRQSGAEIFVIDGLGQLDQRLLSGWLIESWWRMRLSQQFECEDPEWDSLGKAGLMGLMACETQEDKWPGFGFGLSAASGQLILVNGAYAAGEEVLLAIPKLIEGIDEPPSTGEIIETLMQRDRAAGETNINDFDLLLAESKRLNILGEYAQAEAIYRQALAMQEGVFGADNPQSVDILIHLALEVSNQGRFDEAETLFDKAAPLVRLSANPAIGATLDTYLAIHAANRREHDLAIDRIKEAVVKREKLIEQFENDETAQSSFDAGTLGHDLYILGQQLILTNQIGEATDIVKRLYTNMRDYGAPAVWEVRYRALEAEIASRQGQFDKAARIYREIAENYLKLFGPRRIAAVSLIRAAEALLEGKQRDEALKTFRQAARMIAEDKNSSRGLDFGSIALYLRALAQEIEERPVAEDELQDEMFAATQLISAGVTSKTIAKTAARLAAGEGEMGILIRALQDAERERDSLSATLASEARKAAEQRDEDKEARLRIARSQASQKVRALEAQLLEDFPAYNRLISNQSLDLAQVQAALAPGEALVSYSIGEETSFVFSVLKDSVRVRELPVTKARIDRDVANLRKAFKIEGGQVRDFDLNLAYQTYRTLIESIEDHIAAAQRIIIVPSGSLLSLPFALLVSKPPPPLASLESYSQASWLVRDFSIGFAPSIRAFVDLRRLKGGNQAPEPFIGFGNPLYAGIGSNSSTSLANVDLLENPCEAGEDVSTELVRQLVPLPETADEIEEVAKIMGASQQSVVLGTRVTEEVIDTLPLDSYRVVYFATHGLLPGELLCQYDPALAVTPPADGDDDGLLDTSEIAELKLNADIVVLSACNTGGPVGKMGGEALSGLARSFFFAGARNMLVSHWQVPSKATVALMTGMFRRVFSEKKTFTSDALRLSQLDLIASVDTAHPVFWGAFTLVGAIAS